MEIPAERSNPRAPATVALLTVAWLVAVLALGLRWFTVGIDVWLGSYDADPVNGPIWAHETAVWLRLLEAVLFAGPLVIAAVAYAAGLVRASLVYVAVPFVLGLGVLLVGRYL